MIPEKFENTHVGYMFNEAKMCFFRVYAYNTGCAELQSECKDYYDTLEKVASRVKRGMKVPQTWIKKVFEARILVGMLRKHNYITEDWYENFNRSARFLTQYYL